MSNHLGDTNKMVSETPKTDAAYARSTRAGVYELFKESQDIERKLNAASVEIERLTNKVAQLYEGAEEAKQRIKRLEDSYAAKDKQLSNLLHICRDNDIEVSSYDLIHRREAKL